MGIAYRCDETLGCTFVVWDGDVTPQQWRHQTLDLHSDSCFPPGALMLVDLETVSGAPRITMTAVDVMAAAWRDDSTRIGELQMAVLPGAAWDRARRFERKLERSRVHVVVFNLRSSACDWLGIDHAVAKETSRELRHHLRNEPMSE